MHFSLMQRTTWITKLFGTGGNQMKKKTIVSILFVSFLVTVLFTGCTPSGKTLAVTSDDYPKLTRLVAGTFDKDAASNWYIDNPYSANHCVVSLQDSKLKISNETPAKTFLYEADCGYFLGVNLGHYDGWVRYFPFLSTYPEADGDQLVCAEHCHGFEEIGRDQAYLFTTFYESVEATRIRLLTLEQEGETNVWKWEIVGTVDGVIEAYCFDQAKQVFYLATSDGVFRYSLSDRNVTKLADSAYLPYLGCDSMVRIGEKLFCGSPMGVYEFDLNTRQETWYSMRYEKYLVK